MSFPNKWKQFLNPSRQSKAPFSRRKYLKYIKRLKSNMVSVNPELNKSRPRLPTIGPLWNGCINVRNRPGGSNANRSEDMPMEEPAANHNFRNFKARLNNDLQQLWQNEPAMNHAYDVASTSIPSFSINLSGSLFNPPAQRFPSNLTNQHEVEDLPRAAQNLNQQLPFVSFSSSIPDDQPVVGAPSTFSTFQHTSPNPVVSSLANVTMQQSQRAGIDQMSISSVENCNIPPQLTFYQQICSAVDGICESVLSVLYANDGTTMESIVQACRTEEQEENVSTNNLDADGLFSQLSEIEPGELPLGDLTRSLLFGSTAAASSRPRMVSSIAGTEPDNDVEMQMFENSPDSDYCLERLF